MAHHKSLPPGKIRRNPLLWLSSWGRDCRAWKKGDVNFVLIENNISALLPCQQGVSSLSNLI